MTQNFQDSLAKLKRLSPERLDQTSRRIRGDLGSAEWKMGLCLLALKRSGAFRKLGYGTLTDYAERVLSLSGRKTGSLIGAAEALEHLPLMSEAFRLGEICWAKVRAIHGLATPETERHWIEFAALHRTCEVEQKVALSPRAWKWHKALEASIEGRPIVGVDEVEKVLVEDSAAGERRGSSSLDLAGVGEQCAVKSDLPAGLSGHPNVQAQGAPESPILEGAEVVAQGSVSEACTEPIHRFDERCSLPGPPSPPKTIRLVFELTPDQYALYEQAESRVRAQAGRRVPRAEVLKVMADTVLSQGTARARARHQVLVHTSEDCERAWYETERGVLPVGPEVLEEARATGEVVRVDSLVGKHVRVSAVAAERVASDEPVGNPTRVSAGGAERVASDEPVGKPIRVSAGGAERVASAEPVVKPIRVSASGAVIDAGGGEPGVRQSRPGERMAIPNAVLRQVFARARHRCERCGAKGGRLDVHHTTPVSEGGGNGLNGLELLCRACHTLDHEDDMAEKAHWWAAREARMRGRPAQA
jgi:hypothetical protein